MQMSDSESCCVNNIPRDMRYVTCNEAMKAATEQDVLSGKGGIRLSGNSINSSRLGRASRAAGLECIAKARLLVGSWHPAPSWPPGGPRGGEEGRRKDPEPAWGSVGVGWALMGPGLCAGWGPLLLEDTLGKHQLGVRHSL